jgi:hypothetical protein
MPRCKGLDDNILAILISHLLFGWRFRERSENRDVAKSILRVSHGPVVWQIMHVTVVLTWQLE